MTREAYDRHMASLGKRCPKCQGALIDQECSVCGWNYRPRPFSTYKQGMRSRRYEQPEPKPKKEKPDRSAEARADAVAVLTALLAGERTIFELMDELGWFFSRANSALTGVWVDGRVQREGRAPITQHKTPKYWITDKGREWLTCQATTT